MLKYLDSHCLPGKCCICKFEHLCLGLDYNSFRLASKDTIDNRLSIFGYHYQTYEKALMRKTLDDMAIEELETKEKEMMVSIKTVDIEKEKETAREEGYKAGLEEAWEIARKIELCLLTCGYTHSQLMAIFNSPSPNEILEKLTIHEAKEKIAAYEAEQAKPKLGDVVKINFKPEYDTEEVGVYIYGNEDYIRILRNVDKKLLDITHISKKLIQSIEKTGKHFDIQSMLDEIG